MTLNITEPTVGASSGTWGQQLNDALTAIVAYVNNVEANAQPVDSDLTAIAALATTAYGRSLLTQANAAAAQSTLGLGSAATQASSAFDAAGAASTAQAAAISAAATDATTKANAAAAASQPLDSDLTAIAALTTTTFGRSFLALVDAPAARTALGLGGAATLSVGTTTGTVAAGDDSRITGAVPNTRTVNGKPLSANVTLAAADVGAQPTGTYVTGVTAADGTVTVGGTATAPTVRATVGTTTGTVAAGNDSRFGVSGPPTVTTVAASGAAQTITVGSGGETPYDITLTANCTLTFSGGTAGSESVITLIARQDATGGRTVTWPASVTWVGGVAPTLSSAAGAVDIFTFLTVNGGTTWYGFGGTSTSSGGWKVRSTGWVSPAGQRGSGSLTANQLLASPIDAGTGTLTQLAINVNTAAASSTVRVGIYSDNNGVPGTLLIEPTASTPLDTTTTGVKTTGTFSQIITGRVWLAAVAQGGAPTVAIQNGQWVPGVAYDTAANALGFVPTGYTATGTQSGALPTTFPVNNATTTTPTIVAKVG